MIFLASCLLYAQKENSEWISHPQLGCSVKIPIGWTRQQDESGILLSRNKISAAILIMPTEAENFDEVKQQMVEGLNEEGISLSLNGKLKTLSTNIIAGEYSGLYEYQEVQAYIIGTHSKNGSGVYVLAFSAPEKFNKEITNTAITIAKGLKYTKNTTPVSTTPKRGGGLYDDSGLLKYFTGTYYSYTGGGITSGGTERRFVICSNGQFYFSSESGYSGGAGTSGAWGVASQSGEAGTWSIKGSKTSGSIVLIYSNGNTDIVNFQVCGDACIYFNNIKYAYEKAATCE